MYDREYMWNIVPSFLIYHTMRICETKIFYFKWKNHQMFLFFHSKDQEETATYKNIKVVNGTMNLIYFYGCMIIIIIMCNILLL